MSEPTAVMYPSLAAMSTREGITEYLATTFALNDRAVAGALTEFLQDPDHGIYRGPYARVRLPFLSVSSDWSSPLEWSPRGFQPYLHQARAFERLASVNHAPEPTIVTTGTGSGKTEAFLLPILDHARRARAHGENGIKAVILYPMNALVTDQARRISALVASEPDLAGVTAGVYIGDDGSHTTMGADHLIDVRAELRANPPDILLTNYRMLDLLLLREADAHMWAASATSLQYVVLDEFHTYDGAQGTDVAMLLRRLGATLGVASGSTEGASRPLGRICPVATSATLGSGSRSEELRAFAETVFGCPFDADAVVGEERHGVESLLGDLDYALEVPDVAAVLAAPLPVAAEDLSWQPMAQVFLGTVPPDVVALGDALRGHILTRAVAQAVGESPRTVEDAAREVAKAGALSWGAAARTDPGAVAEALLRFLSLISVARQRGEDARVRPLLNVEVQLWVRGVSRVLRELSDTPLFTWWSDGSLDNERLWLPAVYCRTCGSSGWQAIATEIGEAYETAPVPVWQMSLRDSSKLRTLIACDSGAPDARRLDSVTGALDAKGDLPVLVTADAKAAENQRCPACGTDNSIRFIGTSVSTLVSVSLTQLFGLPSVPESEKKTLVFTDSVQDAAHRAAFVEGRAFQFNFRSAVLRAVGQDPTRLPDVVARLSASQDADLYLLAPPDFTRRLGFTGEYLVADRGGHRRRKLDSRLAFQTHLEVGLRSRVGRTLELTGALGVHVDYDEEKTTQLAVEIHRNLPIFTFDLPSPDAYRFWLQGIFDRLRSRGGIMHPWLAAYIKDDGKRWSIWGGSKPGMQKFPRGVSAPTFFTTRRAQLFDSLDSGTDTWLNDWTRRCLDVPADDARQLLPAVMQALAGSGGGASGVGIGGAGANGVGGADGVDGARGPLVATVSASGSTVYGLAPEAIVLSRAGDEDAAAGLVQLVCPECRHVQPVSTMRASGWVGSPCPRMRCPGHLVSSPLAPDNFYRRLYCSGTLRRIIAAEHTGLLDWEEREAVEEAFKSGASPVDPNVLACTPTLELGIDIGDLSSVALSSLPRTPANYLQRVGRAGRSNGNALVLATVPTGPRDLYYFTEPLNLIAGDVVPPNAYLDATELLHRQYLAYCLDRVAHGMFDPSVSSHVPAQLGALFHNFLEPGTWLRSFTDALTVNAARLSTGFLSLFGRQLAPQSQVSVTTFAQTGVVGAITRVGGEWMQRRQTCHLRVHQLNAAIIALESHTRLDDVKKNDLRAMRAERGAQLALQAAMGNQETFTGLSELSLLPNYNLVDDGTTLDVSLWWISDDAEEIQRSVHSYRRGSRVALTEFAPGATFYARGQKVKVNALEPGAVNNPNWRRRRLCPSCGWGADDAAPVAACPRCGDSAIADIGAVHQVLPFREASAEHSRDEVLIDDEGEDRVRRRYSTVTSVDIETADVVTAWRLRDMAFGAEYANRAVVRALNLGTVTDQGTTVSIAGERRVKTAFRTCTACGTWWAEGKELETVRHRGWCPTRKGVLPVWEDLVLSHELVTQAVRVLLPVSVFEHTEHLVAMKGALLLGLRADFGGDPQHLDVVTASMRDSAGRPRRFLVLHDTVPGGTGYLDRIGDPARLHDILTKARTQLATCRCRTEARKACHRCLLSVLGGSEIEVADRALAVRLLDEALSAWDVEPVATVADIDISTMALSELEKRFRASLMAWVKGLGDGASLQETMGPNGSELDLTLPMGVGRGDVDGLGSAGFGSSVGGGRDTRAGAPTVRWRVRPLVNVVAVGVACQPDFIFARQDGPSAPVAVFLDGKEFHASVDNNRTDDDALKRDALRADGYRVWSITWDDVAHFEALLDADVRVPTFPALIPPKVQQSALGAMTGGTAGASACAAMWDNPVPLLLDYLRAPDSSLWEESAIVLTLMLLKATGVQPWEVSPRRLHAELLAAARGLGLPAGDHSRGLRSSQAASRLWCAPLHPCSEAEHGLSLVVYGVRAQDLRPSLSALVYLDDDESVVGSPAHAAAWRDWLHWANVLQFLPLPLPDVPAVQRTLAVWTARSAALFEAQYLPLTAPASSTTPPQTLPAEWQEALAAAGASVHAVMLELARTDVDVPEVGHEVNDGEWLVELSWPSVRVAVVIDVNPERDSWLAADGWLVLDGERDEATDEIRAGLAARA